MGGAFVIEPIVIGLGSNVGDRVSSIFEALERIDADSDLAVVRMSTMIESDAVGPVAQADFVNAAAIIHASGTPGMVMRRLLDIEHAMGRRRDATTQGGPRRIDLDLLLWGDQIIHEEGLAIPHPRMHERAFVLLPLVELVPELVHPVEGISMQALLARTIEQNGPIETQCRPLHRAGLTEEGGQFNGATMEQADSTDA